LREAGKSIASAAHMGLSNKYPLSARIQVLREIPGKIRPEPSASHHQSTSSRRVPGDTAAAGGDDESREFESNG